jgi:C-terminal processing protease CtpA/Prc
VKRATRRRALLPLLLLLPSCGGGSSPTGPSSSATSGSCSTLGQVSYVRDALQGYYYWYRELPNPDPAGFASPDAYLDAVRYRPLDSAFSYITSKAANDAFYSESQYIGFGFSTVQSGELQLRLTESYPDGPAAAAGMERGSYLVSIGGRTIEDLLRTGSLATALGPTQVGFTTEIAWRSASGPVRSATLTKRLVTIPTVSQTALLQAGGTRVGYVHLRNFVTPSTEALSTSFQALRDQGASELVLDLRYNGGGLVSVAQHLGGLIGGEPLVGQVLVQFVHNDKQSSRDTSYRFESKPQALAVTRLVVIATRASASASELIINGLRPFMDVKVVGDRTYGKPVGQYGFEFCEKLLYPVAFKGVNARGEGDYYDGIAADCSAADDLDHPLADSREGALAEALHVVRSGRCSGQAASAEVALQSLRERVRPIPTDGWQQLLNAR